MLENLSSPITNAITLTLVHFLWQGAVVAAVYLACLSIGRVRTSPTRYAASLVTFCALIVCPVVTFAVMYSSAFPVQQMQSNPDGSNTSATLSEVQLTSSNLNVVHEATIAKPAIHPANSGPSKRSLTEYFSLPVNWQPYLLALWLAGVLLSGARLTAGYINVCWLRFGRISIPPELARRSSALAKRLGLQSTRVFASSRIREAAVVGFWKPVVLLPASWLTLLPTDVLEAVIAHELAHIRRYDTWVNLLQRIGETFLFYHPVVWWISNRIRVEREMCCDELAVFATGERGNYAVALERVGRLQLQGTLRLASAFTGDRKMTLLSRVQNVLGAGREPEREPAWLVGVAASVIAIAVMGIGGFGSGDNSAIAQEREGKRSAEAEAGPRRSAEAEAGPRRSAEAEAGPRRSAEGEAGPRRAAERDENGGSAERGDALNGFRPQTQREAALFQMILQLQKEVEQLRREVGSQRRGTEDRAISRDGEGTPRAGAGDGEVSALPARWESTKEGRVFKAYDKNGDSIVTLDEWLAMTNGNISDSRRAQQTQRFNEAEPSGDGKFTPAEFIFWYSKGRVGTPRDGEGGNKGPRDGEGGVKRGPRDGEGGVKGPRDGEGAAKPGPRDRE